MRYLPRSVADRSRLQPIPSMISVKSIAPKWLRDLALEIQVPKRFSKKGSLFTAFGEVGFGFELSKGTAI